MRVVYVTGNGLRKGSTGSVVEGEDDDQENGRRE